MRPHRASLTATKVARFVVFLAHHPRYAAVLPAGLGAYAERLQLAGGITRRWMIRLYESETWRDLTEWVERRTVPGQVLAVGLRKAFMEAETRDALATGARQVLVVGAGFDTLAPRLAPAFPDRLFVEVDHPATQGVKRAALAALEPLPRNLRLVEADLAVRPLAEVVAAVEGWDPGAASVVIAEGLLMYLPEAAVRAFFAAVHASVGPGSRVLFTWIPRDEEGALAIGHQPRVVAQVLAMIGEPLRWGVAPGALAGFLAEQGFRLVEDPTRLDLHARVLLPAGLGDEPAGGAERMGIAEVAAGPVAVPA